MRLLAIDPGPERSAWVLLIDGRPVKWDTEANDLILARFDNEWSQANVSGVVCEMIASYGMAVGREVFETCVWIGRFMEAATMAACMLPFDRITRGEVKDEICHSRKATDANVRTELIDRFGPGKEKAIGKRKTPGPLFGMKGDEWAALAVGIAWMEKARLAPAGDGKGN